VVPWANTFWVRNGNAQTPTPAEFQAYVVDFMGAYATYFPPRLVAGWQTGGATGLYYGPAGAEVAASATQSAPGALAVPSAPANVAACIGWAVQQHYRGGHPRTYLCGIPNNEFATAKTFSSAFITAVTLAANNFQNLVNSSSRGNMSAVKLGVVSFVLRKEWRSPPVFRDFVVPGAHMDNRVDSMRRRLGRDLPP